LKKNTFEIAKVEHTAGFLKDPTKGIRDFIRHHFSLLGEIRRREPTGSKCENLKPFHILVSQKDNTWLAELLASGWDGISDVAGMSQPVKVRAYTKVMAELEKPSRLQDFYL
jgi:hypothetical protein